MKTESGRGNLTQRKFSKDRMKRLQDYLESELKCKPALSCIRDTTSYLYSFTYNGRNYCLSVVSDKTANYDMLSIWTFKLFDPHMQYMKGVVVR